jgi:hypothetical protein
VQRIKVINTDQKISFRFLFWIAMVSIPFSLIYVSHGKLGDDWPASQVIHFIPFRFGELNLRTFLYEMYFNTKAWMDGQGRFMPFSSLSGGLFFVLFETEKSQNLIRLLFLILNILIYSKIVQFFYYDLKYRFFFVFCIICFIKFRWDFDPFTGYGVLLPLSTLFAGLAILYLCKASIIEFGVKHQLYLFMSALFLLFSVFTYEITIGILPALILSYVIIRRTFYPNRALSKIIVEQILLIAISSIYLYFIFGFLRPKSTPTGAYVSGFDLIESLRVFSINILAAIPFLNIYRSSRLTPSNNFENNFLLLVFLVSLMGLAKLILSAPRVPKKIKAISRTKSFDYALHLTSLSLIITPAFVLSIQPAWWVRMNIGNTYLGVFVQTFGMSLFFTSIFHRFQIRYESLIKYKRHSSLKTNNISYSERFLGFCRFSLIYSILFFGLLNFVNNSNFVKESFGRNTYSAAWNALLSDKTIFSDVSNGDLFLSETTNEAYEIHAASIFTQTGIRLAGVVFPPYLWENYNNCKGEKPLINSKDDTSCALIDFIPRSQQSIYNSHRSVFIDAVKGARPVSYQFIDNIIYFLDNLGFSKRFLGSERPISDWPTTVSKPGFFDDKNYWYFDFRLITPDVAFVSIFPLNENAELSDKFEVRATSVSLTPNNELKPAFFGICGLPEGQKHEISTRYGKTYLTNFKIPLDVAASPQNNVSDKLFSLDPREFGLGIC